MAASAQEFAERLGMGEGVQWVAVHHGPSANGNDHIHMVVNLIGDSGRLVNLWQDGMRRRAVCLELEERYGLRATSAAGLGEGSLSRREVDQVRPAGRHGRGHRGIGSPRWCEGSPRGPGSEPEFVERLRGEGLIVRPRMEKGLTGQVVGYSSAPAGDAGGRVVWYGGGTLGKDLRLPALRTRWDQTDTQRNAAKEAWASQAQQARKAGAEEPGRRIDRAAQGRRDPREHLGGGQVRPGRTGGGGLRRAGRGGRGVDDGRAAAAGADRGVEDDPPVPASIAAPSTEAAAATVAVDVPATDVQAAGEAAPAQTEIQPETAPAMERATAVRPASAGSGGGGQELQVTLMGGAARVLMAARLADASGAAQVRALVTQAMQLAAQIARTMAAMEDATAAQQWPRRP